MQIISFLFKKYVKLEKPELRYYYRNPRSEETFVIDQETGEAVKQILTFDYSVLSSNAVLVRKVFDQDDLNFGILIPINGTNEDSFVDPNLLKVFCDINFEELDSSNISSFISCLENHLLPYADNSFNFNYLKEYLKNYYNFFQLDSGDLSVDEGSFLKYVFNGYSKIVKDFTFVERKPLYLSLLTNVYDAFKDYYMSKLEESLKPLSNNVSQLDDIKGELSQIEHFDKIMLTKTELLGFNELEVERQVKKLKSKIDNCRQDFEEAMINKDYDKINKLLSECNDLDKEICDFTKKYSDMYAVIKDIKQQNA